MQPAVPCMLTQPMRARQMISAEAPILFARACESEYAVESGEHRPR